MEERNHYEKG